ncbi:glutathione S-transferase N-terminal domain-containing protein [Bradyrhizobium prioriisuperbiae]|uniref:glutathione S-transferase N-terminal domain-containing protein n=1 Tax=Bradyrhizobium prioriisuperbiae TaxID=2854389 RepID=UPI0028E9B5A2|nr:glutathione S-transferase N-terminal domain-containing protein [Bradyrhizobium prioritasuperba]
MQLYYAPTSPFVRKVLVVAHELGIEGDLELIPLPASEPLSRSIASDHNPTGKVPTLVLESGDAIYDSPVICEVLEFRASVTGSIFPAHPTTRWKALAVQALADGLMEAAITARQENVMRPEPLRWRNWSAFQLGKVTACLDRLEGTSLRVDGPTIAEIAAGCAVGYLEYRFPDIGWRRGRPALEQWFEAFAARSSMRLTAPPR